MMQTLKTEIDYQHALQRLELIFDAPKNSPEDNELEALSLLVYQYEQENYAIDMPNLVEAVKFRMEQLDITQQDFANAINLSNTEVSKIFRNKDNISKKNTILLETTLNSDVFWENLQSQVETKTIWSKIMQYVNTNYLKKVKYIDNNLAINIDKIFNLFQVNSIEELILQQDKPIEAKLFRKSQTSEINKINLITWIKYVEHLARQKEVAMYDINNKDLLLSEMKKIILGNDVILNTEKCLAKYGIKFIVQEKLEKVPVNAVAFWNNNNPVIVMTLRYKDIDIFAFDIFHELGHIFLHLQESDGFIIDYEDKETENVREQEANNFASDALISPILWKEFAEKYYKYTKENINEFAIKANTLPEIIRGRLNKNGFGKRKTSRFRKV